jgi:hypothetical protein
MLTSLKAVFGGLLLVFGSDLDWLMAVGIGFLTGLRFAPELLRNAPGWTSYLIAALGAVLGLLTILIQRRLGLVVIGLMGGGYLLVSAASYGLAKGSEWLLFLVGGVAGGIMLWLFHDWALIVLSTLIGSFLIVDIFNLSFSARLLLFIGLSIAGVLVQAQLRRTGR